MTETSKSGSYFIVDENARWNFINQWQVTEQSNDRMQQDGSVRGSERLSTVKRSNARRQHQLNYKRWSQERHD